MTSLIEQEVTPEKRTGAPLVDVIVKDGLEVGADMTDSPCFSPEFRCDPMTELARGDNIAPPTFRRSRRTCRWRTLSPACPCPLEVTTPPRPLLR